MTWDYRVVRTGSRDTPLFGIYEVYYQDEKPVSRSCEPDPVFTDDPDAPLDEMRRTLTSMLRALDLPVLDDTVFGKVKS